MERAPTEAESAVLRRFAEANVVGKTQLTAQLAAVSRVRLEIDEDKTGGYLDLELPDDVPDLSAEDHFPIDGWYSGQDGHPVFLLLHVHKDRKRLDTLEYYHAAGVEEVLFPPAAAAVHIGLWNASPSDAPE